jgi:hypothetical protein
MKRHCFFASVALALLSSVGLASPMLAADQVPFKGTLEGSFTVIAVAPPAINRQLNATGNATQLGSFTYDFPHSVDRSVNPAIGQGYATFTAANGDQVFAYVTGQATPTTPGQLHVVETGEILGGTGRFQDASGDFVVDRTIDTVNLTTSGSFEGTIASSGAAKH